jgi:DNA mismatch repair protein MutS2
MQLDHQSKVDLEFDSICELLAKFCKSTKAKDLALNLQFFPDVNILKSEFELLEEIQNIHHNDSLSFPHANSEDIDGALKLLRVENGVLILDELIKIYALCSGTKNLIKFSKQNRVEAPLIYDACAHIDSIDDVLKMIRNVLDEKALGIKDDASKALYEIRNQLRSNRREVNKNFENALKVYRNENFLADTEETHLENKRLLTVLSQYKKRVKGRIVGISSKGMVTYIEPEINVQINRNQDQLRIQEQHELYLILEKITLELRSQRHNLKAFQRLLVRFDVYNAKVRFADIYNGIKPKINTHKKMYWENATHPLLKIKNKELGLNTIGQKIELDEETRFLVISGPNAGGKSITLKTVGLVQMMFQSGLFLPLNSNSQCCWFENIYSDIGDNQSIENQLSTYSYRINRMKFFLEVANEDTLLLLDEFGSGSDPELGGALAEVFYEELYRRNTFAVITTHYTNIKILTSTLPNAINACMLFDTKNLKPLYELSVGQPGSSFTFEVAQFNGITPELLDKAKLKVSESKIKIDELTVALQKEKSKFKKINSEQYLANTKARAKIAEYDKKLSTLANKQSSQIQFFEQQNKFVNTGKKIYELIKKFKKHKTNKLLNEAVKKIVGIEQSKLLAIDKPVVFNQKLKAPELTDNKLEIEELKKNKKELEEVKEVKVQKPINVGDKVRLKNQTKIGEVIEVKGKKVSVIIGNFTFNTTLNELEHFDKKH